MKALKNEVNRIEISGGSMGDERDRLDVTGRNDETGQKPGHGRFTKANESAITTSVDESQLLGIVPC